MQTKEKKAEKTVLEKLAACALDGDTEVSHGNADDALCEFLIALGYKHVADKFQDLLKWYA